MTIKDIKPHGKNNYAKEKEKVNLRKKQFFASNSSYNNFSSLHIQNISSDVWFSMQPEALEQHISVLLRLAQKISEHLQLLSALALLASRPVRWKDTL